MTPWQWSLGYFNPSNNSMIAAPGWDEDVDFDGFSNLEEYLFATDPVSRSSIPRVAASNTEGTVSIQYSLSSTALDSVEARLESSEDLEHWQDLGAEQWSRTDTVSGMALIEVKVPAGEDGFVRMGFRLQD